MIEMENSSDQASPQKNSKITPMQVSLNQHFSEQASKTSGSSSSKVIEALHQQIDTLQSTNLQLTYQTTSLMKQNESLSTKNETYMSQLHNLKHENASFNSILDRKNRKIKELEELVAQFKLDDSSQKERLAGLEKSLTAKSQSEQRAEQEQIRLQVSYDSLVEAQKQYTGHYKKQIAELQEQLEALKDENEMHITKNIKVIAQNNAILTTKLGVVTKKLKEVESKYMLRDCAVQEMVDTLAQELNTAEWNATLETTQKMVIDYAEKMELKIPQALVEKFKNVDVNETAFVQRRVSEPIEASPIYLPKRGEPQNDLAVKRGLERKPTLTKVVRKASVRRSLSLTAPVVLPKPEETEEPTKRRRRRRRRRRRKGAADGHDGEDDDEETGSEDDSDADTTLEN